MQNYAKCSSKWPSRNKVNIKDELIENENCTIKLKKKIGVKLKCNNNK
jgi:hypothetical protein